MRKNRHIFTLFLNLNYSIINQYDIQLCMYPNKLYVNRNVEREGNNVQNKS